MPNLSLRSLSEATSREAFVAAFCEAAQQLRKDPYRVGLLSPENDALFLSLPLPNQREFWVAERDGRLVGRVGASISTRDPQRGAVGFFETEPSDEPTAFALLRCAEAWLRSQGVTVAYGPMNINTWFTYRFRIGGTDDANYTWEPVNPPEYPGLFERAGYEQDMVYVSNSLDDLGAIIDGFEKGYRQSLEDGYTYRPVDTAEGLERELSTLYRLSLGGFRDNHLFDPIPESLFRMLYVAQARKRRSIACFYVVHPDHGEVGYAINFVDEAEQFLVKSLVVLPEHRGKKLSLGLLHKSYGAARELGFRAGIAALVQVGNRSEAPSRRSSVGWQHRFALYRKTLKCVG